MGGQTFILGKLYGLPCFDVSYWPAWWTPPTINKFWSCVAFLLIVHSHKVIGCTWIHHFCTPHDWQFGCEHIETSTKTGQNIEHLFMNLICAFWQTRMEPGSMPTKTKEKKLGKCIIPYILRICMSVLYHPPHNPHGLHWIPLDSTGLHWTSLDFTI